MFERRDRFDESMFNFIMELVTLFACNDCVGKEW